MKKKIFAGVLALSMFLVPTARADELTDPYIDRIGVDIMPPQYADNSVSGPNPSKDEWKESVKSQGEIRRVDGAVKWERDQKEFKIKKVDQNGGSVEGVVFSAYNTKEDAENNRKSIGNATSGEGGYVDFKNVPLYYEFYIKETSVPEGYDISKEIIPVYRDNGVRFIGEKKSSDFKVEGGDLTKYLQSLLPDVGSDFIDQIDWLVFNDNGTEKLIPKKSLKRSVSWNHINNAGLVDGSKTVTIDGKTYKIRLIRAFNDTTGFNDPNSWKNGGDEYNSHVKGSEWNRLILPLIKDGRYGSNTEVFVEANMPTLANYSWGKDFGGNKHYGAHKWTQDKRTNGWRAVRGDNSSSRGAAASNAWLQDDKNGPPGWLPVLELAENN